MPVQDILQPAVRLENIDLGELTWEVGHASRDDGHKDQVLVGAGLGEIGDDGLFGRLPWPAGTLLRIWGRRMSRNAGVDGKVSI